MDGFYKGEAKTPQHAAMRFRVMSYAVMGVGMIFLFSIYGSLRDTASFEVAVLSLGVVGFAMTILSMFVTNQASEYQLKFMGWKPPENDSTE